MHQESSLSIYKTRREFIIIQDGAPEDQIRKVVKECPSAALKIEE